MGLTIGQVGYDIKCEIGYPGMEVDTAVGTVSVCEATIHFCYEDFNGPLHERFVGQDGCLSKERIDRFSNVLVPCRIGT